MGPQFQLLSHKCVWGKEGKGVKCERFDPKSRLYQELKTMSQTQCGMVSKHQIGNQKWVQVLGWFVSYLCVF